MKESFICTCTDHACPYNPVNHAMGCTLCVEHCLETDEIPSCFFRKVSVDLSAHADWSYEGFAQLVLQKQGKSE